MVKPNKVLVGFAPFFSDAIWPKTCTPADLAPIPGLPLLIEQLLIEQLVAAKAICQQRTYVYEAARLANQTCWSGATRCWSQPAAGLDKQATGEPDPLRALGFSSLNDRSEGTASRIVAI